VDRKRVAAWALFDFANSIFPVAVITVGFNYFFIQVVVGNEAGEGDLWWGRALGLSAAIVALSSPLLGAIADRAGARKRFMLLFTALCVGGVALFTTIQEGRLAQAFLLFVIANVGFEGALVFYNAYLRDVAPPERQGWVSGLGFGVGYLGSAVGLLLVMPFFADAEYTAMWVIVAVFFALFSVPSFVVLPSDGGGDMTVGRAAAWGVTNLRAIVAEVLRHRDLTWFLVAFFFYIDGVLTAIAMANSLAVTTFGFTREEAAVLFLVVQFAALAGAFALAKPTDVWGPKRVLSLVLVLWVAAALSVYFIESKPAFYVLAIGAGFGLGSVQAASRAFMSSLIPEGRESEMFGFYALCGKSSSIIGPNIFGQVAVWTGGNQRMSVMAISVLFVVGLVLLQRVRDPKARRPAAAGA
jgi:UMF1 family MFS transporter